MAQIIEVVKGQGAKGDKGWSPEFAVATDGERRVLQLQGYVGGAGTEPTDNVNEYVGASGYTATIGSAIDIRGASPEYSVTIDDEVGTTYTLTAGDEGEVTGITNASAITVTLPNDLPEGYTSSFFQGGAGKITFSAEAGATIRQIDGLATTRGQYAFVTVIVLTNSDDVSAEYLLAGDLGS